MNKKHLTKREIEQLIKDDDPSIRFVIKKKTSKSSELWNFFHQIFINDHQQQFRLDVEDNFDELYKKEIFLD